MVGVGSRKGGGVLGLDWVFVYLDWVNQFQGRGGLDLTELGDLSSGNSD